MSRRHLPVCLALLLAAAPPRAAELEVQPPEPGFGYTIGDRVAQRIFPAEAGVAFDVDTAPVLGRVTPWLQRIVVTPVAHADGRQGLELVYQVVNVPGVVTRVELPAVTLALLDGTQVGIGEQNRAGERGKSGERLGTGVTSISIGPLLPSDRGLRPRADRQPAPVASAHLRRIRDAALLVLAACLLGGVAWWLSRAHRDATRLPFARAWRTVRRASPRNAGSRSSAWGSVHAALNDTAGGTVHAGNLADVLAGNRWLAPHAAALNGFFQASDARFFDPDGVPDGEAEAFDLTAFAHTLMRAERGAAR